MKLGSLLLGNGVLKKNVKVVNKGPKEVNLKWKIYPYNKLNNGNDIFKL